MIFLERLIKASLFAAALVLAPAAANADAVLAPPATASADPAPAKCTLTIHITGLRNRKGFAAAVIFKSPDGWPEREDKSVVKDGVPVTGKEATLTFELPPGRYGVAALHDENENHKLDRNFLGIPIEGFGFANNPRVFLTAPPFREAEVNVTCPATNITIKMIYK